MQKTISIRTRTGILSQPVYDTIYVGDTDAYELKIELANLTTIPGTVVLRFVRPDDVTIEQIASNISGNVITHVLTEQQTAVAGELKMYIRIVEGETELYTTTLITFPAVTALAGGNIVPSEADQNIVAQIVGVEALRVEAEFVRETNELERVGNEEDRVIAESDRIDNEDARVLAEQGRVSAESLRVTAESNRVTAESARSVWETYNPATSYSVGNKVYYLGSSYICHTASTGNLPTNTDYWSMIASKGDQGIPGGDIATASELPIVDSGAHYTSTDVEGALQEVASDVAAIPLSYALDDISDVTITTPASGQALLYDGTGWANGTVSTVGSINDLNDVTITTPADSQLLTYDNATSQWVNKDAPSGGQYLGTATTKAISYNSQSIAENITIPSNVNASAVGPITVETGFTLTVETGARLVIL